MAIRRRAMARDPFHRGMLVAVSTAVAVRTVYVLRVRYQLGGGALTSVTDAEEFRALGRNLAAGRGYVLQIVGKGPAVPTAGRSPAWPVVLAGYALLGLDSPLQQRLATVLLAAVGVGLVGILGRRIGGPAAGLAAAGIAALHPGWVQPAGILYSEDLYLVVVAGTLLVAHVLCVRGGRRWALALGALCATATLTRSEAVLLVPLLGVPVAWATAHDWRRRFASVALVLLGFVAFVGPWMVRNAIQLDELTLSDNLGITLAGANCDETFRPGESHGGWTVRCAFAYAAVLGAERLGKPGASAAIARMAIDYASAHLDALPSVVATRVGRLWGVTDTGAELSFDQHEGLRSAGVQRAAQLAHWVVLPAALAGAVLLRGPFLRRWILLAPLAAVTLNAAVVYGSTRMRVAAEPSLAVLAGVAVAAALSRLRRARAGTPSTEAPPVRRGFAPT